MPKKTLRELQKSKFLTVYNEDKGIIEKIVFPNNLQVGTDKNLLPSDMSVYGVIAAGLGFSGSLTRLPDGKSYLIASKIAATLSSVGCPSFSISANDCSHGNLGSISKKRFINN